MNDLPVGRSVDETLRLVQAFQYTDQHGEVCPAGWKPGSDTVSEFLPPNSLCLDAFSQLSILQKAHYYLLLNYAMYQLAFKGFKIEK